MSRKGQRRPQDENERKNESERKRKRRRKHTTHATAQISHNRNITTSQIYKLCEKVYKGGFSEI